MQYSLILSSQENSGFFCSMVECKSWILLLLNIISVIYLAFFMFYKRTLIMKMVGYVWTIILASSTIVLVVFHTCIFSIICAIVSLVMIFTILAMVLKQDNEKIGVVSIKNNQPVITKSENVETGAPVNYSQPNTIIERVTQDIIYKPQEIQEQRQIVYDSQQQVQTLQAETKEEIDMPVDTVEQKSVQEPVIDKQPIQNVVVNNGEKEQSYVQAESPENQVVQEKGPEVNVVPAVNAQEKEAEVVKLEVKEEPEKIIPKMPANVVISNEEDIAEVYGPEYDDFTVNKEKIKEAVMRETIERARAMHKPIEMPPKKVKFEEVGRNNGLQTIDMSGITKTKPQEKVARGTPLTKIPLK